jgi:hypothetical protein
MISLLRSIFSVGSYGFVCNILFKQNELTKKDNGDEGCIGEKPEVHVGVVPFLEKIIEVWHPVIGDRAIGAACWLIKVIHSILLLIYKVFEVDKYHFRFACQAYSKYW